MLHNITETESNLSLDCPPLVLRFSEPAIYLSQRYIPNNVTLKIRPVPAFGWAPVIRINTPASHGTQFNIALENHALRAQPTALSLIC